MVPPALAEGLPGSWRLAENRIEAGVPLTVFVEAEKTPGRPAFKIETIFEVRPSAAAVTLMHNMLSASDLPDGQRREVLESSDREALVYTFIDLPFLLADRELALRVVHSDDPVTGIHRIDWHEENAVLPEGKDDVVRLSGARGYWEFRPDGDQRTRATYLTQTEVGGSIPKSIADRLLKGQAVEDVERLRGHIEKRRRTHVAAGPPSPSPSSDDE
jgi:hypothetical protein